MKKLFKGIGACLIALIIALSPINMPSVSAAEDSTPPKLMAVEVLSSSVNAGDSFKVRIKVEESETGLSRIIIQFNDRKFGLVTAYEDKVWESPVYSSGKNYIEHTFTIPTRKDFIGGEWHIGYMVLYDQKGNSTYYESNFSVKENKLYTRDSKFSHTVSGNINIKVNGGTASVPRPVINSVKILNPTVEKGQNLKVELNVTSSTPLSQIAFYIPKDNWSDVFDYSSYDMPKAAGTHTIVVEIPISTSRHIGDWEIQDIYITDTKNNDAHFTNQLTGGYFADYHKEAPGKFDLLKFKITGVAGDETRPIANSMKVLNDELIVTKPGILYLEVDITEEGTGVECMDFHYMSVVNSVESPAFSGWARVCLKKYDNGVSADTITIIDKPLKTGKHVLEVPIPAKIVNGQYRMHVDMRDGAENVSETSNFENVHADFFVKDEFDYSFEIGITNKTLLEKVKAMQEGEAGKILLSNNYDENVLPKEVFEAIANQKKILVCYKDGYQWVIDGKKIHEHKAKDINLTARIYVVDGKYLSSGKQAIALSFPENGKLPGNIEFRFKSAFIRDFFGKEQLLHLYHVEHPEIGYEEDINYIMSDYAKIPDNQAMFKIILENSKDAWCSVNLNHNSKYVISDAKITKLSDKQIANLQKKPSKPKDEGSKPTEESNAANDEVSSQVNENDLTSESISSEPPATQKKDNPTLVIILVVLLCVLVLGAALAFLLPKSRNAIKEFFSKLKK